jgi:maltooligosyltrehalose trehalohydrolase
MTKAFVAPQTLPDPYRFGPMLSVDGQAVFRLWAPSLVRADVLIDGRNPVPMQRGPDGFMTATVPGCAAGMRYMFRAGGRSFPDPASRQQAGDTDGWSLLRHPMAPSPRATPLRPWHETVICEVHVGTATPDGTFTALAGRLEHFRDAGYTCLEIMPVNAFPGSRNWGYDGTLICAPETAYGTPEELRALVDRAHELGLCMVLDVVYNHFGEYHNFLPHYAPEWFDERQETPWGPGIDFSQPMVRQFYYENARMWLTEYDFDGLRFDSVHEIKSDGRDLFLGELSKTARAAKPHAKLIIENMENTATWLERDAATNEATNFVAQWNDDIHHVLDHLVTGSDKHGYDDPCIDAVANLQKALADGYVHDGEAGTGAVDGPGSRLPPDAFICYAQNHDQIGNRADASRLVGRIGADKLDFLRLVGFAAPQIPLFFMGEEGHLRTLFPFFVDLPEEEAQKKRDERNTQMREAFKETIPPGGLPDPNAKSTFQSAKLNWPEFGRDEVQSSLARFRLLAGWRRDYVWPLTATPCLESRCVRAGSGIVVNWIFEAGTLSIALNPSDRPVDIFCVLTAVPISTGEYAQNGELLRLGAWAGVAWVGGR